MDWKFVLVLALGVTYSQGSLDRAYTSGHEYVYEYEAQLATGMPEGTKLYSGLKIKTDVRFQFKTVSRVTMKMQKIRLYKLNDVVEGEDPTREQLSVYTEMTGTEAEWMMTWLSKPITFKYTKGHITEIKSESGEEFWSLNVKRGVLSLLEMNLEERRSLESRSRLVEISRDKYSPSEFYRVMEPSVVGDCETTYRWQKNVPNEDETYMYLTKVRNYMRCLDRPVYTRSIFNAMRCAQCEKDRTEPFKSGSQIRYVMKGNPSRFIIQSAIGESQHVFTPYSNEGGHVTTYINQTFVLVNQESIKDAIRGPPRTPEVPGKGLQADVQDDKEPWQPLRAPSALTRDYSPQRTPDDTKQVIMKIVELVYANSKETVTERTTSLTFSLMDMLKQAEPEVLRAVWDQYDVRDEPKVRDDRYHKYNKRKVLLDILPMTGTPAAVEFLTDYIKKTKIRPDEAQVVLTTLTVTSYADIKIAKYILELVRDNYVKNTEQIRRAAYLYLGAVADRIRNEKDRLIKSLQQKERQIIEIREKEPRKHIRDQLKSRLVNVRDRMEQTTSAFSRLKQDIIKELRTWLTTGTPEDLVMALKSIGNTGFPDFLPDCKSIIAERSKPQLIRTQAIYSLRKIATYVPEAVRTTLWPYYFNVQEPEEVRIASYLLITSTNPPRPVLELLAQSLYREYNPHVGTFVYTHLEQLSNSTHPCLMSWAKNATFALRFARKFNPNFHYSRFWHFSNYIDKMKMGGSMEMGYVSSPEEYIPRSGAVHTNMHVLGYSTNVMEVGFNTEGLQKIASKLLGPGSKLAKAESLMDILTSKRSSEESSEVPLRSAESSSERSSRSEESAESVRDIHDKLKVDQRYSPTPRGHIYFKFFNNEVSYVDLDESILKLIQKGLFDLPSLKGGIQMNMYKSMILMQEQHSWFTELGFPINFKFKSSATYKMTGEWNIVPNGRGYEAKFNIVPSMVLQTRAIVESEFYYYKSGAGIKITTQAGTPLTFSVVAEPSKGMFSTKFGVKNLKENWMNSDMRPTFFIEKYYKDISKEHAFEEKFMDQMEGAVMIPINIEYGKREMGLTFGVKGQFAFRDFLRRLPYYPFYGRSTIFMTVAPGLNPPEMTEFQFMLKQTQASSASVDSKASLEELKSSSSSKESSDGYFSSLVSLLWGSSKESQIPRSEESRSSSKSRSLESEDLDHKTSLKHRVSSSSRQESRPSSKQDSRSSSSQESRPSSKQDSRPSSSQESRPPSSQESLPSSRQRDNRKSRFHPYEFVFRMVGVGCKPERWFQFEGQHSTEPEKREHVFVFKYSRTPYPELEKYPYNVEVKGTWMYPKMRVEPLFLLDSAYQSEVRKLIQLYTVQEDKRNVDAQLLDIPSRRSIPQRLDRMLSPSQIKKDLNTLIEEIVHEQIRSPDSQIQQAVELIKQQKQVSRKVKAMQKQRHNVLDVVSKLQKLKVLIEKVASVSKEVSKKIQSSPRDPIEELLIKVAVLRQQANQQRVEAIGKALRGSLDRQKRQDLKKEIKKSSDDIKKILRLQADVEQRIRSSPRDLSDSDILQKLRRQQAKVLKDLAQPSPKVQIAQLEDVGKNTEKLIEAISSSKASDEKVAQLLNAVVQHQQILKSLKQSRKSVDSVEDSPEISSEESIESDKRQLKKVIKKLKEQSRVVALVVQIKQDAKEIDQMKKRGEPQTDIQIMKELSKAHLEQIQIAALIPQSRKLDKRSIAEIVRKLSEISRKTAEKVDEIKRSSPVIQKIKQVSEEQLQLLDKLLVSADSQVSSKEEQEKIQKAKLRILDIYKTMSTRVKGSSSPRIPSLIKSSESIEQSRRSKSSSQQSVQSQEQSKQSSERSQEYSKQSSQQSREQSKQSLEQSEEPIDSAEESAEIKRGYPGQMFLNIDFKFGYHGQRRRTMNIQMVGKKSMEQLQWEAKQISPRKDELVQKYLEEKDENDAKSRHAYRQLKRELNMFRHYHWKVKYNKGDFEPSYRMMFWRMQDWIKFSLYNHGEFEMPKETSDIMEVVFDIKRNNEQMDVVLSTPLEWDKFWAVNMPWMVWFDFFNWENREQMARSAPVGIPFLSSIAKQAECEIRERSIRTFDQRVMQLPDTRGCDVIVAMDCSPAAKVVIKARNKKDNPKHKVITAVVDNKRIEIVKEEKRIVKVNGIPQELKEGKPVLVKRSSQVIAEVSVQDRVIVASLPQESLQIIISYDKVIVKASPLQYSKLCGLCGNYDGIPRNDMENAQRLRHKSVSCLVADYIRPSDRCDPRLIKDQCRKEQPKSPEVCAPEEKTKIKTRVVKGQNQICFSVGSVKECKRGCAEIRPKGKRIAMKCLNKDSRQAQMLLGQSHHRPLSEISSLSVPRDDQIQAYVKEPYSCSKN